MKLEILGVVFFAFFLAMLACMLPYFRSLRRFLDALMFEAKGKWQQLGEPSLSFDGSPISSMRLIAYLFRGDFTDIPNSTALLGCKARRYLIFGCVVAAAAFLVGLISAFLMSGADN